MQGSPEERLLIKFNASIWPINPKGNRDTAFSQFKYAVFIDKADSNLIYEKWKEYNEMCQKEQRDSKFVKSLENFLKEKGWNGDYKSRDGRTKTFIDAWLKGLLSFLHL